MTPLEKALEKQNRCNDTTKIGNVLYCNKSGKIIHPLFVKNEKGILMCDIQNCRNRKTFTDKWSEQVRKGGVE